MANVYRDAYLIFSATCNRSPFDGLPFKPERDMIVPVMVCDILHPTEFLNANLVKHYGFSFFFPGDGVFKSESSHPAPCIS